MIKPSIGRVVLVYRGDKHIGEQWNTAQICEVISDTESSVAGFDRNGDVFKHLNITLYQYDVATSAVELEVFRLLDALPAQSRRSLMWS